MELEALKVAFEACARVRLDYGSCAPGEFRLWVIWRCKSLEGPASHLIELSRSNLSLLSFPTIVISEKAWLKEPGIPINMIFSCLIPLNSFYLLDYISSSSCEKA